MGCYQAGNYSSKYLEEIAASNVDASEREVVEDVRKSIMRAIHFGLPDCGQLLPRSDHHGHPLNTTMVRPPFDSVVLEYSAVDGLPLAVDQVASTRRLVLITMSNLSGVQSVRVIPVPYVDKLRMWRLPVMAFHILLENTLRPGGIYYNDDVRIVPEPLLPRRLELAYRGRGLSLSEAVQNEVGDATDELNAYFDLCMALSCRNVGTQTVAASKPLNLKRIKSGRAPLFDYRVLTLGGPGSAEVGESNAGLRGSPRAHLRRGHVRRLASGAHTWVNAAFVNGGRGGFLHKSYRVLPA